jgi:tetratricopeptide (TPR) repeat protein
VAVLVVVAAVVGGGIYWLHGKQVNRQAGDVLARAEAAAAKGDTAAAVGLFQNYLKLRPRDLDAYAKYAAALEAKFQTDPATVYDLIKVCERIIQLDPARRDERRKLARWYVATEGYPNARANLAPLLAEQTADADPDLQELAALSQAGDQKWAEAADHYRKALATGKAPASTHLAFAVMLREKFHSAAADREADAVMNQLIDARRTDPKARLARADYHRRFGDMKQARADVEFAFRNLPGAAEDPDILFRLAELAAGDNDLPTAKQALAKAAELTDGSTRARLTLAEVQARLGETETALKTLRTAAEKATTADLWLVEVADRMIDLNDPSSATKLVERLAAAPGLQAPAEYLNGRLKLTAGDWPAAVPLLRKAVNGLDKLPHLWAKTQLVLAECFRLADDPDQQLRAFDEAIRADPAAAAAHVGRAEVLARMGRHKEAVEAVRRANPLTPAARGLYCRLVLADQLSRPARERNWAALDEAAGAEPQPAEVVIVRARGLMARGQVGQANELLTTAAARTGSPELWAELAVVRSVADIRSGFAVLDDAEKKIGDRVEFRLGRARLLLTGPKPDVPAAVGLGVATRIGSFPADARHRLLFGLGDLLARAGQHPEAIDCLQRAAAEKPTDLTVRLRLFDLAVATNDTALQDAVLADIGRIEGTDGPVRVVADASRAIPGLKPGDKDKAAEWRGKLTAAGERRGSWGAIPMLLGRLDELAGDADAAATHYRRAFDLGQRGEPLLRGLYGLLLNKAQYSDALEVLDRAAREAGLPADLTAELIRLKAAFGDEIERTVGWAKSPQVAGAGDYRVQLLRGEVLSANGQLADARSAFERAVSVNPTGSAGWTGLVRVLAAAGKLPEAQAATEQAAAALGKVAAPPAEKAAAVAAVGLCRELVGDLPRAEAAYREAITAAPADDFAHHRLVRLLTGTGRADAAVAHLEALIKSDISPALRRWARRAEAGAILDRPDWYDNLSAALDLIELNVREANGLPEDVRAKAVVVGADPFRLAEAIKLLTESAQTAPLTADQNYHLARLYLRQGRADAAEKALQAATAAVAVADPAHLALLAKTQFTRGDREAARRTVNALQTFAPNSLAAATEQARLLAADGRPADGAKRLATAVTGLDPVRQATVLAPLLEEVGCVKEAEEAYRRLTESGPPPAPHRQLVAFLLRTNRPGEAIAVIRQREAGTPAGVTARLLAAAARAIPPGDRALGSKAVEEIDAWVRAAVAKAPADPNLLTAKAMMEAVAGRWDAVVPAFRAAADAAPDDDSAQANLAFVLAVYDKNGSDANLSRIDQVIRRKGPVPSYLDTRAVVHLAGERYDAAVRDLTAAIGIEPKPVYHFHLAQVYDRRAKETPEVARQRDEALAEAGRRGLTKAMLDPKEWAEYDRLMGGR